MPAQKTCSDHKEQQMNLFLFVPMTKTKQGQNSFFCKSIILVIPKYTCPEIIRLKSVRFSKSSVGRGRGNTQRINDL